LPQPRVKQRAANETAIRELVMMRFKAAGP
jgi:hypothetical protein